MLTFKQIKSKLLQHKINNRKIVIDEEFLEQILEALDDKLLENNKTSKISEPQTDPVFVKEFDFMSETYCVYQYQFSDTRVVLNKKQKVI